MAVARFAGAVLLTIDVAAEIATRLGRYAGQLPPCRERTEVLDYVSLLRGTDVATLDKVSRNVSVQGGQVFSCNDSTYAGTAEVLTPGQAAAVLGITSHGVRHLARTHALPAHRTTTGRWLLDATAVRQRAARNAHTWSP